MKEFPALDGLLWLRIKGILLLVAGDFTLGNGDSRLTTLPHKSQLGHEPDRNCDPVRVFRGEKWAIYLTTIVAFIPAWYSQWYAKLPAVSKVKEKVAP